MHNVSIERRRICRHRTSDYRSNKNGKYKFVITTPISATCANTKEKGDGDNVFYKDQGGKLRTMECTLQLQKLGNVNVLSEKIALKLTLYYEDKTEVSNQEILQIPIMVQEQCFIENGTFQLKFRIEDVSKITEKEILRID